MISVVRLVALVLCLYPLAAVAQDQSELEAHLAGGGLESLSVPEGFTVEIAAGPELASYPMFMAFDDQGRMYIAESSGLDVTGRDMVTHPECMILRLEDVDGDGVYDKRTVFADKLSFPMGVLWHDGSVYVASPPELLRFDDTDGDGIADERHVLLTGWNMFNSASLHGPFLGPDGWLYLTHGRHGYKIETWEGEVLEGLASRVWRCRLDGTQLERVAGGGFDNPIEVVWGPAGDMFGTMTYITDPRNGQRDALLHYVEGGVYPKWHESTSEFTQTGDLLPPLTRFARIAPSGLERYRGEVFGAGYTDNFFSAQFNPHRVQRHVLTRDGATYRCEDSDFLTSTFPHFHPTDVLEDADGSLLVSDTGGWYVDACPISRIAMPQVRGTIYRVRKDGAPRVDDPWGRNVDWAAVDAATLTALLSDSRPRVQDHAVERLVALGGATTASLSELTANTGALPAPRIAAVQALARIATPNALAVVRDALGDATPELQAAAARTMVMTRDPMALFDLLPLLHSEQPWVRRQSAEALSHLRDPIAVTALLNAASHAADRFEEHSLIYAVIQTADVVQVRVRLRDDSPAVRRAALIALDQMANAPLRAEDVTDSLTAEDEGLRHAALWVASHHTDWSESINEYIQSALRDGWSDENKEPLRELLLAFQNNGDTQDVIAQALQDDAFNTARKQFLLDTIEQSAVQNIPASWSTALGALLGASADELRWQAASMIQARNIADHDAQLLAIAGDEAESTAFRVSALSAVLSRQTGLTDSQFDFLIAAVLAEADPTVRQTAAQALSQAPLSAAQMSEIAQTHLKQADALVFPSLLNVFLGGSDETVGLALVASLQGSPDNMRFVSGRIDELLAHYPESVRQAAEPLRAQAAAEEAGRVDRLLSFENKLGQGDVGRGRQIFFGDLAACSTCHAVGEEGGRLGPDLTTIGAIRSAHDLLEAILFPSASFVPDYEPYRVKTDEGIAVGVISRQTPEAIVLMTAADAETFIPRDAIASMTPYSQSIMPEGLDVALTEEQLVDLIAFLRSLNNEVWLLPELQNMPAH